MKNMSEGNEIPVQASELVESGIVDAAQAARNLQLIRKRIGDDDFRTVRPDLLAALRQCGDPDMAMNHLERFLSELDPPSLFIQALQAYPPALFHLVTLFGASRLLSVYAASHAGETLGHLSNPLYLDYPAEREVLEDRLFSATQAAVKEEDFFRSLRLFRKQEMLRISLRDLLGKADLSETTTELSNLAEVTLQTACEWAGDELRRRHGRPETALKDGSTVPAEFAVIGMGKLGGGELNFSSDIDLMYVYSADGETSGGESGGLANRITNHQYFVKLGEMVSAAIGRNTADGFVFRVDLRLRPEGQQGPLAQSLGGYEIYYESWGQTWERSALIKARPVVGNGEVGREFVERITPFVYRKYLDFSAIVEIREMKQKINREVQLKGKTYRDVKLGYGGIREIEFLVQALHLIYGGRDRTLRERNTLRALYTLAQKGLLSYEEASDLSKAYHFLRTVEHRIQMLNDLQSQTLPTGETELRGLARRTGYLVPQREAEALLADYALHTGNVRRIYDKLLGQAVGEEGGEQGDDDIAALLDPDTHEQDARAILVRSGFRDPERAVRNIFLLREGESFAHQTPRSRRAFRELFPLLFREVIASPDPDMALHHLESFLAARGSWDAVQTVIQHSPRVPEAIISVFGNSEYFSRILIRTPELLHDLLEHSWGEVYGTVRSLGRSLDASLEQAPTITDKLDALRRFKQKEELRIGMADLTGTLPLPVVCRSLSRLADACVAAALRLAAEETAKRSGGCGETTGMAVIGAGKLGGRELIYGSDLDVFFVYDESRSCQPPSGMTVFEYFSKVAEKAISYLSTMTREGSAYRVDTRLRPTGSKGPLVQAVDSVLAYVERDAETWERQSLIHARFVSGDREVGAAFAAGLRNTIYRGVAPSLAADVRAMRKRMEEERGREDTKQFNIKQGTGGLVDIEFLAQYLQLRYGGERSRVRIPGTLNALCALRREGVLWQGQETTLRTAYLFLRRLESRMRVVANQSSSNLVRDPEKIRTLARRMGFADGEISAGRCLLDHYEELRKTVRGLFEEMVG